jgi:hypothetical protein
LKLLRPISFLLLCVLLFYSTGYYFAYQVKLSEVKQEGFARIHDAILTNVVTISSGYINGEILNKDIELVEENEISWQGKMYDIISSTTNGNTITFKCVSDSKEDEANTAWVNHVKKNTEPTSDHSSAFKPFLVYMETHTAITFQLFVVIGDKIPVTAQNITPEAYLNIPSPPPWSFTV